MKKFMAVMGAVAMLALPVLVTAPASVAAEGAGSIGGPVMAAPVSKFDILGSAPVASMTLGNLGSSTRSSGELLIRVIFINKTPATVATYGVSFFGLVNAMSGVATPTSAVYCTFLLNPSP